MKEFNELIQIAESCSNQADSLRTIAKQISFNVGYIAKTLGSGYLGQKVENMRPINYTSGEQGTKRLIVAFSSISKDIRKWQVSVEHVHFPVDSFDDDCFCANSVFDTHLGATLKTIDKMSISDITFMIETISDFLTEWYEDMKRLHARRKVIRVTAEKISLALQS